MNNDGMKHIHRIMHVFIEGLAAGVYDSVEDIQADAKEYLEMERVVQKLSNWKDTDNVDDLAQIFAGLSKSIETRKQKVKEEKEWADVMEMPNIGE